MAQELLDASKKALDRALERAMSLPAGRGLAATVVADVPWLANMLRQPAFGQKTAGHPAVRDLEQRLLTDSSRLSIFDCRKGRPPVFQPCEVER